MWNIFNHLGFETICERSAIFLSPARLVNQDHLGPFFASPLTVIYDQCKFILVSGGKKIDTSPIRQKFCHLRVMLQKALALLRKINPRLSCQQLSSQYIGTKGVMGTQTRGGAHRAQVAFLSIIFSFLLIVSRHYRRDVTRCCCWADALEKFTWECITYIHFVFIYVCVCECAAGWLQSQYVRRETE
jgi:hypothetical protein